MLQDILDTAKEKMKKSCEVYERDMMGLRAGRANPKLLDRIMVDYYGTQTPIPQIGNISSPEPRLLVIAPWEAKMIPQVEKAIQKSDLGLNPSTLKSFYQDPAILGLASRKNPHLIILRYPRDFPGLMKTIYHECWHAFQMKDENDPMGEDGAYWYMEDAYKRYCALSVEEQERLFLDELLMKDYRKK